MILHHFFCWLVWNEICLFARLGFHVLKGAFCVFCFDSTDIWSLDICTLEWTNVGIGLSQCLFNEFCGLALVLAHIVC